MKLYRCFLTSSKRSFADEVAPSKSERTWRLSSVRGLGLYCRRSRSEYAFLIKQDANFATVVVSPRSVFARTVFVNVRRCFFRRNKFPGTGPRRSVQCTSTPIIRTVFPSRRLTFGCLCYGTTYVRVCVYYIIHTRVIFPDFFLFFFFLGWRPCRDDDGKPTRKR